MLRKLSKFCRIATPFDWWT